MVSADAAPSALQPTVSVVGDAALRAEPDEALLSITLSAIDASPGPALADVARRSEALADILDELAVPREDRSTTGVTVTEEFDHTKQGRRSLGHRALAGLSLRLSDAQVIGRVMARASDELDARIAGPAWRISPANPVWLDAATQASSRARAKAAAYAAGVDARLGALISLSEPEPHRMAITASAAFTAGPDMHVESGAREVVVAVSATFALETDGRGGTTDTTGRL